MEAKYSTIEALNQRWKSNYATFEDIQPVALLLEAKAQTQYAEFISSGVISICDRWTEAHRLVADLVKQKTPALHSPFKFLWAKRFWRHDYWRLMTEARLRFFTEIWHLQQHGAHLRRFVIWMSLFAASGPKMTHRHGAVFRRTRLCRTNVAHVVCTALRDSLTKLLDWPSYRLLTHPRAPSYASPSMPMNITRAWRSLAWPMDWASCFLEYE